MSQKDSVGVALQKDLATAATTMTYWPPVTAENMDVTRNDLKIDETFGTRAPRDAETVSESVGGKIDGAVRPSSIGAFLSAAFGAPVTTATVPGSVFTHVWDAVAVGAGPLPLSILSVNADMTPAIAELYRGCMVNSLDLSCATKDYMLMSADILGFDVLGSQTVPSITRDGSKKFRWDEVSAKLGINGAAASAIKISDWTVSYGNGIALDDPAFGESAPSGMTPGDVTLTSTFTVLENLGQHRTRALMDTPDNCNLILEATGPLIDGTNHISLKVDIARLRYTKAPVDITGKDIVKNVKVECAGSLDEATNKLITITLVNGEDGTKYLPAVA